MAEREQGFDDAEAPRRGEEDEDYDLLTFDEAGVRLAEEIERERARLAEFERAGDDPERPHAAEASRLRLEDLRAAAQRNGRRALDADGFEKLFGYRPGDPRRRVQSR
jgi:hypothetical protein